MTATVDRRDHHRIDDPPGVPARGASDPACAHGANWWRVPRTERHLRRRRDDRLVAGVAAGLSARLGVDVTVVRIGLVLSSLASGIGLVGYVAAWLVLPEEGDPRPVGARAVTDRRGIALVLALLPAVVLLLVLASATGAGWVGSVAWPGYLSVAGLVLVWRNATPDDRQALRQLLRPLTGLGRAGPRTRAALVGRLVAGGLLAVAGAALIDVHRRGFSGTRLVGLALVAAAVVMVVGPWWLDLARQLVDERQARARAEERADMAARVHDSVLQTLALIERRADDPHQVARLARAQARDLRSWLFDGRPPGAEGDADTRLGDALRRVQREVEDAHGVPVEVVAVGDCALTDGLRALVAAGREAAMNAAAWSGATLVSVFAEVEAEGVVLFVRDRGAGFDRAAVGAEHRGLADSIEGRMRRHGGRADIRSAPGAGTEVRLAMARPAGDGAGQQSSAPEGTGAGRPGRAGRARAQRRLGAHRRSAQQ